MTRMVVWMGLLGGCGAASRSTRASTRSWRTRASTPDCGAVTLDAGGGLRGRTPPACFADAFAACTAARLSDGHDHRGDPIDEVLIVVPDGDACSVERFVDNSADAFAGRGARA
ncbi:MAG: hypothetical protein R3F59_00705 [Myxococcota bacterium]